MAQTLFKLGIAEAAASVLGGLLKFNPLGFVAGGVVQAVTMAYLTRLTGASFLEYVEHGQTWGEGGMQATLTRHLEATRRTEWLADFAKAVLRPPLPPSPTLASRISPASAPRSADDGGILLITAKRSDVHAGARVAVEKKITDPGTGALKDRRT